MKLIQLTKNKSALVDDCDYEELSKYKWYALKRNRNYYASRHIIINNKKTAISIHNQIIGIQGIDHINHNGLDNRRCNLRPATISQNNWNSLKRKNTTSKYKGVYWCKITHKWLSKIKMYGKSYHLGYYKKEIDAARAYNIKAKELFGEYAKLNVMSD
jgi:hypothetical protein